MLHPDAGSHGEQVGLGALFCTFLRGDAERFAQLARCLSRHGLPVLPAELGLTDDEFVAAVAYAPSTRPGRYTILEHLDLPAAEIAARLADYAGAVRDHAEHSLTSTAPTAVAVSSASRSASGSARRSPRSRTASAWPRRR